MSDEAMFKDLYDNLQRVVLEGWNTSYEEKLMEELTIYTGVEEVKPYHAVKEIKVRVLVTPGYLISIQDNIKFIEMERFELRNKLVREGVHGDLNLGKNMELVQLQTQLKILFEILNSARTVEDEEVGTATQLKELRGEVKAYKDETARVKDRMDSLRGLIQQAVEYTRSDIIYRMRAHSVGEDIRVEEKHMESLSRRLEQITRIIEEGLKKCDK